MTVSKPLNSADAGQQFTFTVFTATYNRALTLPRVYSSLQRQTFRDFEWLVIDDGSTDCTPQLLQTWQAESDFPIRYLWQENQGKHTVFNRGVQEARGELFLNLDSDDACVPEALERLKYHWDAIPAVDKPSFSAVTALCMDRHGRLIGSRFPYNVTDSDSLEIRYRFKVKGEKWGFHRTSVLRQFPFPSIEGVRFVPEGVVWAAVARQFKTRFVNEPLRIYWADESDAGSSAQLTKSRTPAQNAAALALWHKSVLNGQIDWLCTAPQEFLRSAMHFSRFSFHVGVGGRTQRASLTNFRAKALWALMLPLGLAVYIMDSR